jgi:hypothetical protein
MVPETPVVLYRLHAYILNSMGNYFPKERFGLSGFQ